MTKSKNAKGKAKQPKQKQPKPASNARGAAASTRTVPTAPKSKAPPTSVGFSNSKLNAHFTWSGPSSKMVGVETRKATFRQQFSLVQKSSSTAGGFPTAPGVYPTISRIPLSPMLVGGAVFRQGQNWKLFKFENISLEYIPSVPTTETSALAIGYDPNPITDTDQIDDATNLGQLFTGMLNLAAVAAGPVWGPLVMAGGNIARTGAETLLTRFQNRKAVLSATDSLVSLEDDLNRATALDSYLTDLSNHVTDVDNALVPPIGGNPPYTVGPLLGDNTEYEEKLIQAIREMRGVLHSEILATTQGHVDCSFPNAIPEDPPGTGTFVATGYLMISGSVTFSDPITLDQSSSIDYGDPLDLSDPAGAPFHQSTIPGARAQYLHMDFSSFLSEGFQVHLVKRGLPRLTGPIFKLTHIELEHANRKLISHHLSIAKRLSSLVPQRPAPSSISSEPSGSEFSKGRLMKGGRWPEEVWSIPENDWCLDDLCELLAYARNPVIDDIVIRAGRDRSLDRNFPDRWFTAVQRAFIALKGGAPLQVIRLSTQLLQKCIAISRRLNPDTLIPGDPSFVPPPQPLTAEELEAKGLTGYYIVRQPPS